MSNLRNKLQEEFSDKAVEHLKVRKAGLLDLCLRFGKTRTALLIIHKLLPKKSKILISYPDNNIKESWETDIAKFSSDDYEYILTNSSSLKKHLNVKYDMFIIDEIHALSERELDYCMTIQSNSSYLLGLSGTLGYQITETLRIYLLAEKIVTYTVEQAIQDEIVSNYKVYIHQVPLDTKVLKKNSKGKLVSEKTQYDNMTRMIDYKLAKGQRVSSLIYFTRTRILQGSISKLNKTKELLAQEGRFLVFTGLIKVAEKLGIPYHHSKKKSSEDFDKFQNGTYDKLALAASGKMGVTYKNLDGIILPSFTGNTEDTTQILFRAILLDFKGKEAKIHIITSNEEAELKKLRQSLRMLNKDKIVWIT